jgi:ESS family glutamate:Na+ symporter
VAAAMSGIVVGGLVGGPLGTRLIERHQLRTAGARQRFDVHSAEDVVEARVPEAVEPRLTEPPAGEDDGSYVLLKTVVALMIAMWMGSWVSRLFSDLGITLPAYIGAMLIAALIRNVDDMTGIIKLPSRMIDDVGNVALSLFLVMALMTIRLWELAGLAIPLLVIILGQIVIVWLFSLWAIFRLMGKDYDAAVMSGGFVGFMLGTTANAMANMRSLVERYGPAPRAFLVVPMVGAFFIDFTNAIIITIFLNLLR